MRLLPRQRVDIKAKKLIDGRPGWSPLLDMNAIYSKCMKIVYDRLHKPQKPPLLADIPMADGQVSRASDDFSKISCFPLKQWNLSG
jgi:hypothetical protein